MDKAKGDLRLTLELVTNAPLDKKIMVKLTLKNEGDVPHILPKLKEGDLERWSNWAGYLILAVNERGEGFWIPMPGRGFGHPSKKDFAALQPGSNNVVYVNLVNIRREDSDGVRIPYRLLRETPGKYNVKARLEREYIDSPDGAWIGEIESENLELEIPGPSGSENTRGQTPPIATPTNHPPASLTPTPTASPRSSQP